MSWLQKLYDTYENNITFDQTHGSESKLLRPLSHSYQSAVIEVTLNGNSEFVGATVVAKDDMATLIPVTDSSGMRSGSGLIPHPLSDQLMYIAGDFPQYGGKIRVRKDGAAPYDVYMEQLNDWANWSDSHVKVRIIRDYLAKSSLIRDLIDSAILSLTDAGVLANVKINGYTLDKMLVRFVVLDGSLEHRTWKDESLIQNWLDFLAETVEYPSRLDLLTGKFVPSNPLHPKGILPGEYGAKIISSNDTSNYTYRGRFKTNVQAANLGYESSQKVHAALTWLLENQGVSIGTNRRYVYFSPNPKISTHLLTRGMIVSTSLDEMQQKQFRDVLLNIKTNISPADEMIVIGVEAPTPGQLSIVDYYEFSADKFVDYLLHWTELCSWYYLRSGGVVIDSPSFYRIANVVYGVERNGRLETDDKVFRDVVTRLQKYMLTNQSIPYDMIRLACNKASNLQRYEKNRFVVLSTVCALIHKYNCDSGKGVTGMVLDTNCSNRSYLFGRLLAIYERIEKQAMYKPGVKDSRETNAMRLQQVFALHPNKVWMILEHQVDPYLNKLSAGSREFYRGLITNVVSLFVGDDARINKSLDENYLLGYYLQRADFYNKPEVQEDTEDADETVE